MQKQYETYNAEQFLEDAFFIEWIKHQTPGAARFWTAWVESAPPNLAAMREAEWMLRALLSAMPVAVEEGAAQRVWAAIQQEVAATEAPPLRTMSRRKPLYRIGWAAAILAVLVAGYLYWGRPGAGEQPPVAQGPAVPDLAPGGDKAILTLADGTRVVLDTAQNGALASEGGAVLIKLDGQLAYEKSGEGEEAAAPAYNTITTPRGGQYQLVLSDGSRVWLNAASSLRFPTAFSGGERRVELTGEGYFEVAHHASKPFYVAVKDLQVQVLGTRFNVNAYEDEAGTATTLLQGSVSVNLPGRREVIRPGQQALVSGAGALRIEEVETAGVVAWKNGLFHFEGADIQTVMRQLARWYDVEVTYEGTVEKRFVGKIPRNVSAQNVFRILEETGGVHFKVSGREVTVMP